MKMVILMKVINIFISGIIGILLFFLLLHTSLELVAYNVEYYSWQYDIHNIPEKTGTSLNELTRITKNMIYYLKGNKETLDMSAIIQGKKQEVFNEREKEHMVDVKRIFQLGKLSRNICGITLMLVFIYIYFKNKKLLTIILSLIKYVFAVIFMLILILSGLLLIDFNKYFTIFHEIFFTNDLWLLNPKTDILINMVPEIFFFQTAMIILGIFVLSAILLLVLLERVRRNIKVRFKYND